MFSVRLFWINSPSCLRHGRSCPKSLHCFSRSGPAADAFIGVFLSLCLPLLISSIFALYRTKSLLWSVLVLQSFTGRREEESWQGQRDISVAACPFFTVLQKSQLHSGSQTLTETGDWRRRHSFPWGHGQRKTGEQELDISGGEKLEHHLWDWKGLAHTPADGGLHMSRMRLGSYT